MINISKSLALLELERGNKIRHRYFMEHEYVYKKKGILLDECGHRLQEPDFWNLRTDECWQTGWEVVL